MNIYLYQVGRNLNRCIRLCYSYGFEEINLVECGSIIKGNLYSANKVRLIQTVLPVKENTVVFEKDGDVNFNDIFLSDYENIIIGGESVNLPKKFGVVKVRIPTVNNLCLTTESCLSIILNKIHYERTI